MLHYRDKRVKGLFKLKMFSFLLFCFTYCFLVHSACIGAEEPPKGIDNLRTIKGLSRESLSKSVSFSSYSSDSSNSPTSSSKSSFSGNSSPSPEEEIRASENVQKNENNPVISRHNNSCDKKRGRLTRSLSYYKHKEKCAKSSQKPYSITENEEKKLSLSDLLTEAASTSHENDEKNAIAEELLSSFVDEKAIFAALIDLEGHKFEKLQGTYPRVNLKSW